MAWDLRIPSRAAFVTPDADKALKAIFDDPSATEIGHWLPLFDGPLHRVPEAYFWERAADQVCPRAHPACR